MYIDLIIKIKNAQAVKKERMKTRFTRMDKAVADILQRKGFLKNVEIKGRPSRRVMYLDLEGERSIEGVRFTSTPSIKRYRGYKSLRKVKGGYGIAMLTTPKGVMTEETARNEKVGGQLLCEIW
jgi:small subunit ribosomal protein S8